MSFWSEQWDSLKELVWKKDEDLPMQEVKEFIDRAFAVIENILYVCLLLLLIFAFGWGFVASLLQGSSWFNVPAFIAGIFGAIFICVNAGLVVKRYLGAKRVLQLWALLEFIFLILSNSPQPSNTTEKGATVEATPYIPITQQLINKIVGY